MGKIEHYQFKPALLGDLCLYPLAFCNAKVTERTLQYDIQIYMQPRHCIHYILNCPYRKRPNLSFFTTRKKKKKNSARMTITKTPLHINQLFIRQWIPTLCFHSTAGLYRDIRSEEALSSCCAFAIIFQGCFFFNQAALEQRTIAQR